MPTKEEMILKIEKTIGFSKHDMACDCNSMADKVCFGCSFSAGYNSHKNHVMIGDVLDWMEQKGGLKYIYGDGIINILGDKRKEKRKPIEENPEAIIFIYSITCIPTLSQPVQKEKQ